MSEDKVETTIPVVEPQKETVKVEPEVKVESLDELKLKVEQLTRTVTNKEQEAERVHKKLEKFEQEEIKRKEAELSEIEKLNLRAEKAEKESVELKLNLQRREIAAKLELPEILIDRIKGVTPEEMEADAKKLIDELPKATKSNISATNPGGGNRATETPEQTMKRLGLVN
jgi:hypothetical protein